MNEDKIRRELDSCLLSDEELEEYTALKESIDGELELLEGRPLPFLGEPETAEGEGGWGLEDVGAMGMWGYGMSRGQRRD